MSPSRTRAITAAAVAVVVVVVGLVVWRPWHDDGKHSKQAHTGSPARPGASPTASASAGPSSEQSVPSGAGDLAAQAQAQAQAMSAEAKRAKQVVRLTMANFNTLGASHTSASGKDPGMASGAARGASAGRLLVRNKVDVVTLQEFQGPQAQAFQGAVGTTYSVWPGTSLSPRDGENSVAWRTSRFDLVRTVKRYYPYFYGKPRLFPLVLLRDKASGTQFWVTSFHNPANTREFGNQARWKSVALAREIPDINKLLSTSKLPLIVAGDMNDRDGFFCPVVARTSLHAANGGSSSAGVCRMPRPHWIDWILGSPEVTFSGYHWDQSADVRRTSDHPIVITQAAIRRGAGQTG